MAVCAGNHNTNLTGGGGVLLLLGSPEYLTTFTFIANFLKFPGIITLATVIGLGVVVFKYEDKYEEIFIRHPF
jgi:hypothetical protein